MKTRVVEFPIFVQRQDGTAERTYYITEDGREFKILAEAEAYEAVLERRKKDKIMLERIKAKKMLLREEYLWIVFATCYEDMNMFEKYISNYASYTEEKNIEYEQWYVVEGQDGGDYRDSFEWTPLTEVIREIDQIKEYAEIGKKKNCRTTREILK